MGHIETYNNLQGSAIAVINEQGEVVWRESYQPFGKKTKNEAAAADNSPAFTGHVQDKDTRLLHMQARYYDPRIGRFMSQDPVGFVVGSTVSFNRYAYANNNPYKYVDPDGQFPFDEQGLYRVNPVMMGGGPRTKALKRIDSIDSGSPSIDKAREKLSTTDVTKRPRSFRKKTVKRIGIMLLMVRILIPKSAQLAEKMFQVTRTKVKKEMVKMVGMLIISPVISQE